MADLEHPLDGGSSAGSQVEIDSSVDPSGAPLLKLSGELDISSVPVLRAVVDRVMNARPSKVVFDLSAIRFMDSAGIAVLLSVAEQIGAVEVRNPSAVIQRVIEFSGLSGTLRIIS